MQWPMHLAFSSSSSSKNNNNKQHKQKEKNTRSHTNKRHRMCTPTHTHTCTHIHTHTHMFTHSAMASGSFLSTLKPVNVWQPSELAHNVAQQWHNKARTFHLLFISSLLINVSHQSPWPWTHQPWLTSCQTRPAPVSHPGRSVVTETALTLHSLWTPVAFLWQPTSPHLLAWSVKNSLTLHSLR